MKARAPTRESVTTINEDGSRYFLYPADVRGRFTTARRWCSLLLLAVYVLLPWIQVGGYPAVFLDVLKRRFHLFGFTFSTEDMWLLFFVITGLGFSLFYVTALFGRVWCGWTCPYTVFLEHVYRRVERLIDGDAPAARRLRNAPWTFDKIRRRVLKHGVFLLLSSVIAHVFLSYFVSLPRLYAMVTESPAENWKSFGIVTFLTGSLYFCFSWFREQFCIIMCPYGRIQSALTDDHTVGIGYDEQRGEPRGKASDPAAGDCIDCFRCVNVCPTGIDIRDGLQIECIGCANCIDACDEVMAKLDRPAGLVRYDSEEGLRGKKTRWIRPRTLLYSFLLLAGITVMSVSLLSVKPAQVGVVRMIGAPYYVGKESVRNQFRIRLLNKRTVDSDFLVRLDEVPAGVVMTGFDGAVTVAPMEEGLHTMIVEVPFNLYAGKFDFKLKIVSDPGGVEIVHEVKFLGPDPRLLDEDFLEKYEKSNRP